MTPPPRLALWLACHSLAPHEREYVLGDLDEGFSAHAETHGPRAAARWYVAQVCRSSIPNLARRARSAWRAVRPDHRHEPSPTRRRGDRMPASILHDIRFGLRLLLRQPARSLVLIATLALGIGANAALFTLVNTVVLRPLPYPEPERLVRVWERDEPRGLWFFSASIPHYFGWHDGTRDSFSAMGAYREDGFTLARADGPVALEGVRMTASLFDVLRVAPVLGRPFLADEDRPGGPPVVVVSHDLWRRELNANPAIVGQPLSIDGQAYTVVGVMPQTFRFPQRDRVDVMMPYGLVRGTESDGAHFLRVLARMKSDATPQTAGDNLSRAAWQYTQSAPENERTWKVVMLPLHTAVVGDVRDTLIRLQGACLLVLLIATINVANLLVVRAADRSREIAVRAALGASTFRLIRQLLTESLVLAALGSVAGLALAQGLLSVAPAWLPDSLPRVADLSMDRTVILLNLALSLATGLLFGIAPAVGPALRARGLMTGGASRSTTSRSFLVRRLTVGLQLGLALTLLAGAALLVQSSLRLADADRGFASTGVLTFDLKPPARVYQTREQRVQLYRQIDERLRALPGVTSVGLTHRAPFTGYSSSGFRIVGRATDGPPLQTRYLAVSRDYFEALGITRVRGRAFDEQEVWERGDAAIVNQAAARQFWPNEEALGQRIVLGNNASPLEIVGIVANTFDSSATTLAEAPVLFVPYARNAATSMTVAIRTAADPATLVRAAAREIAQVDALLPISGVQTMDQRMDDVLAQPRFNSALASLFAVLALILAAVGVYGVIGCLVAARTREFGIRLALGAQPAQVIRQVLGEGVRMAIVGVVLGVGAALALGRLLADLLYDVTPSDPATLTIAAVTLFTIAIAAAIVPARRVLRVDPIRTLNEQ